MNIIIDEENGIGERLDIYLSEYPELSDDFTRSRIQNLINSGNVLVNGAKLKSGYKLRNGDYIDIVIPDLSEPPILPENIPLDIYYEDDDLIVVNKPKGMVVHPANGHYSGTLVNALMYHCKDSLSGINGVKRPGIVHRIDMDTTGLLIVCKNDKAHNNIAEQLKEHSITRRYAAICHGRLKEDGIVDAPIGRHNTDRKKMSVNAKINKPAVTHYHVIASNEQYSYIECILETGRTHQIRVHMSSIGHPLLGDMLYGPSKCPYKGLEGQTLHAYMIGFQHPSSGEYMEFKAPLPDYFDELLKKMKLSE